MRKAVNTYFGDTHSLPCYMLLITTKVNHTVTDFFGSALIPELRTYVSGKYV